MHYTYIYIYIELKRNMKYILSHVIKASIFQVSNPVNGFILNIRLI